MFLQKLSDLDDDLVWVFAEIVMGAAFDAEILYFHAVFFELHFENV